MMQRSTVLVSKPSILSIHGNATADSGPQAPEDLPRTPSRGGVKQRFAFGVPLGKPKRQIASALKVGARAEILFHALVRRREVR